MASQNMFKCCRTLFAREWRPYIASDPTISNVGEVKLSIDVLTVWSSDQNNSFEMKTIYIILFEKNLKI